MQNKMRYLVGALACVMAFGAGCAGTAPAPSPSMEKPAETAPAAETGPIKIGFIGPLTGDASSLGVVARAAAELAAEEINAAGGVNGRQIEMVYEDGKCNGAAATNAVTKLLNVDKVVAINGGLCSSETAAFGPSAMQNKVVTISYCSSAPTLTGMGKYFFRSYPSDAYQGKFAAEYVYNTLGLKKVAIVYHVSDWGTGLKTKFEDRFKELGGEVVAVEGSPQDNKDYRTAITKVKAANPDLVYAPLYPDGGIAFLKQYAELGMKTRIYAGDAWADTKLQKEVGADMDVIYSEVMMPSADEFNAKVMAKTKGTEVSICASQAYDNMKLLAQVMGQVGTDADKVTEALHALQYKGVSGDISFDQNGDLTAASYVVKKIENGKGVEIK
jgi:branched-chain amino acid transport system substrate-binding protein